MNNNAIDWQIVGLLNRMPLERTTVSLRDAWAVGVLRSLTLTREGWQVWAEDAGEFILTIDSDTLLVALESYPVTSEFLAWIQWFEQGSVSYWGLCYEDTLA